MEATTILLMKLAPWPPILALITFIRHLYLNRMIDILHVYISNNSWFLAKINTRRYFLPEDGDNEENPNVFLASKPSRPGYPPLLGQIKDTFPLPGNYHFRFKTALVPGTDRDKHAVAVWMDCVDDNQPVQVWQNSIVAKVTRLGLDEEGYVERLAPAAPVSRVRTDSNVSAASVHSSNQPVAPDNIIHTQSTHDDSLLGSFDDPPAPAAARSAPSSSGNLLDVDNHPPAAPASGNSLLDMDVGGYGRNGATTPTTAHDELLNMSVPTQPPPQQQQPMQQQQAPMQNQYGMQYPAPGQQQKQQQRMQPTTNGNKPSFNNSLNPLDSLKW